MFTQSMSMDEAAASDAFALALGEEIIPQEEVVEEAEQEEVLEEELEEGEEDVSEEDEEGSEEISEDEDDAVDEPDEEEGDEQLYVIELDGEEYEVSEDELLSGYKRTQDFQKESKALQAKQAELDALIEDANKQRASYTTFLEEELEKESEKLKAFSDIDWNKLKAEDANQFLLKQYEMNEVRQAIQAKREKFEKAQAEAGSLNSTQSAKIIEREQARVKELVEGWGGDEHDKIVSRLQAQASTEGFTDDDNDLLKHAQVIKLLDKAAKYDALQVKKEGILRKKVNREVPKVIKPGKKQQIAEGQRATANKKQFNKLKQTGSLQDSVPLFEQFL